VAASAGGLGTRVPSLARLTVSLQALDALSECETISLISGLSAMDSVEAVVVVQPPSSGVEHLFVPPTADGRLSSLLARLVGLRRLDTQGISAVRDQTRVRRSINSLFALPPCLAAPPPLMTLTRPCPAFRSCTRVWMSSHASSRCGLAA
jgi:hypothetical protein